MKIAFISSDFAMAPGETSPRLPGGACYYRCVLPAKSMAEFGDITAGVFCNAVQKGSGEIVPMYDSQFAAEEGWDIIVMQRWMWSEMTEITHNAQAYGQTIVQDIDDHMWDIHYSNSARAATDPTKSARWNADNYASVVKAADIVTVSTPFLQQYVQETIGHDRVSLLPNMIDMRQWKRQAIRDTVRTIGWVGSTKHRSNDLEQIAQAVRHFMRAHPDIRFVHGGHHSQSPRAAKQLGVPATRTDTRPLLPIDQYPQLWQGIDIALCPLNVIDFNRAKSAIKAMEASASGVPFIATELDAYTQYGQGLLARTGEWRDALEDMLSVDLRTEIADDAHRRVEREDVSLRWADWVKVYG
jgi:glycosyltransferase involved in cell wall biosynthesis